MEQESQHRPDLVLHYIERVHGTMLATGESINRVYLLQCVGCILTAFVSLGIASADNKVSVGGLTIIVPAWTIVIGLSILVAAAFAYLVGLSNHLGRLRQRIVALYASIGYDEPRRSTGTAHPLEYPDISSVVTDIGEGSGSQVARAVTLIANWPIVVATLILFPVVAQITVAWYLVRSFGWTWLDTIYIIFIALNMVANCASFALVSWQSSR